MINRQTLAAMKSGAMLINMAWVSVAARERLLKIAAANIAGWMEGRLQNEVS